MKASKISYALLSALMLAGAVVPSVSTLAATNQAISTSENSIQLAANDNNRISSLVIDAVTSKAIGKGGNAIDTVLTGNVTATSEDGTITSVTAANVNTTGEETETISDLDTLTDEQLAVHLDGIVADIQNKYGEIQPTYDENGEWVITEVEEARMDLMLEEFFAATGYSPMLQMARLHLGKHWWNSTTFVQRTIDLLCYAAGMGVMAEKLTSSAVHSWIKKHSAKIVSFLKKTVLTKLGITVTGISNVINIALIVVGTSVGGVIAEALDRLDGTNNNYLWS